MDTIKCNEIVEHTLRAGNHGVAQLFSSEVIILRAPMRPPVDDIVKNEIEELRPRRSGRGLPDKLTVILETTGGFVETVERLAGVFRHHYRIVEFVVPNYAYSAGTLLVLSGDEIYMDYYSILGPIDPQLENDNEFLPGMGYLAKYEELVKIVNSDQVDPKTTRAELSFLINKFDPAKLFLVEQAIEHSKSLLREWLPKYKFKTWKRTATRRQPVTQKDRERRADEIASALGNAKRWHSHGRGIGIKELESEEIKLKVVNYEKNRDLYTNISHYYGLFIDYLSNRKIADAMHSQRGIRRLA